MDSIIVYHRILSLFFCFLLLPLSLVYEQTYAFPHLVTCFVVMF
jgi:hypothetical protein